MDGQPAVAATNTPNTGRHPHPHRSRPQTPQNAPPAGEHSIPQQQSAVTNEGQRNRRRPQHRPPRSNDQSSDTPHQSQRRPAKPRAKRDGKPHQDAATVPNESAGQSTPNNASEEDLKNHTSGSRGPGRGGRNRAAKFNAGLTTSSEASGSRSKGRANHSHYGLPQGDDLTSSLTRGLSVPPYTDCPICFNAIHPAQPTWSCSPSIPIAPKDSDESSHDPQYCWSTFHLKCIKPWAEKSYKDMKEAWRTRGEPDRDGEWRCPGCQGRRLTLIDGYRCFCGATKSPQPRLGIPHSCGNPCSRPRTSCSHPCPLSCHPGPCPPCKIVMSVTCGCPKREVSNVRCADAVHSTKEPSFSCGNICSRPLSCGNPDHRCDQVCHSGDCKKCDRLETLKCWCSKNEQTGICGEVEQAWNGPTGCGDLDGFATGAFKGFSCDEPCGKFYDCGKHTCEKPCHPLADSTSPCPFKPEHIRTCPCGRIRIASSREDGSETSSDARQVFPSRSSCTSPIPTCDSICSKPLPGCDHLCSRRCHTGPCPPCETSITLPCRCGSTLKTLKCGTLTASASLDATMDLTAILCDKPCNALQSCGRHRCQRICCPLASVANAAGKGRNKRRGLSSAEDTLDAGDLHECDRQCGRLLSCGNHRCEERDHRGNCAPCLQSSFEELFCPCGRTVVEPPVPCGTVVQCSYPCDRPPLPCGHNRVPHTCHSENVPCPPCPFLTEKLCACGKKTVGNIKCSLEREKVGCGSICGKLMDCGFHHCDRLCHAGDCGNCTEVCGKPRKLCLPSQHPCQRKCHAPASCPEHEPCQSLITLTCPCGRIKQSVRCNRCEASPAGRTEHRQQQQQPKCNTECGLAKRNARLADAFGINTAAREKGTGVDSGVTYTDELLNFARSNMKFVALVEKAFQEFISSAKKTQVLPHMPVDRRQFVRGLASAYRMDTQMVDQEPNRSVQLIRRIDSRVPAPLISAYIASRTAPAPATSKLGRLADFRAASATASTTPQPKAPPRVPGLSSGSVATGVWGRTAPVATLAPAAAAEATSAGSSSRSVTPPQGHPTSARVSSQGQSGSVTESADRTEADVDQPVPDNWEDN